MRYVLITLVLLFFVSCDKSSTMDFAVQIKGVPDGTPIFLQKVNQEDKPYTVDTLEVVNGVINAKIDKVSQPEIAILHFPNLGGNFLFFIENKDITGDINFLSNIAYFNGGNENFLFNEYKTNITEFSEKRYENENNLYNAQNNQDYEAFSKYKMIGAQLVTDEKSYKKSFAENNINMMVGLMALQELIARREITYPDAQELLSKRNKNLPENIYMRLVNKSLASLQGAEIGNLAPDFSGPTPEGDIISLKQIVSQSKVTLIDFWASWCKPCRMENPNVVRVHNKYKNQGFNIISVSLDRADIRDRWLQAIKDDQMNWYHISHLQHWDEPVARLYNVRSIPATFLVDSNGIIVAKNLRGDALDRAVNEFINR